MTYGDPYSRYNNYKKVSITDVEGETKESLVLQFRKHESPEDFAIHTVTDGETMDYLAWKYYGNEKLWWKIADANEIFADEELENFFPKNIESEKSNEDVFHLLKMTSGLRLRIPLNNRNTRVSRWRNI